jgi:hypothetical protein
LPQAANPVKVTNARSTGLTSSGATWKSMIGASWPARVSTETVACLCFPSSSTGPQVGRCVVAAVVWDGGDDLAQPLGRLVDGDHAVRSDLSWSSDGRHGMPACAVGAR